MINKQYALTTNMQGTTSIHYKMFFLHFIKERARVLHMYQINLGYDSMQKFFYGLNIWRGITQFIIWNVKKNIAWNLGSSFKYQLHTLSSRVREMRENTHRAQFYFTHVHKHSTLRREMCHAAVGDRHEVPLGAGRPAWLSGDPPSGKSRYRAVQKRGLPDGRRRRKETRVWVLCDTADISETLLELGRSFHHVSRTMDYECT